MTLTSLAPKVITALIVGSAIALSGCSKSGGDANGGTSELPKYTKSKPDPEPYVRKKITEDGLGYVTIKTYQQLDVKTVDRISESEYKVDAVLAKDAAAVVKQYGSANLVGFDELVDVPTEATMADKVPVEGIAYRYWKSGTPLTLKGYTNSMQYDEGWRLENVRYRLESNPAPAEYLVFTNKDGKITLYHAAKPELAIASPDEKQIRAEFERILALQKWQNIEIAAIEVTSDTKNNDSNGRMKVKLTFKFTAPTVFNPQSSKYETAPKDGDKVVGAAGNFNGARYWEAGETVSDEGAMTYVKYTTQDVWSQFSNTTFETRNWQCSKRMRVDWKTVDDVLVFSNVRIVPATN